MRRAAVYDFDGTVTSSDSLIRLLKGFGMCRYLGAMLCMFPRLLMMKAGLMDPGSVKERLFSRYFRGMPADIFCEVCDNFARRNPDIIRPAALESIQAHIAKGDRVIILSASAAEWIRPFFPGMPIEYVCTGLEVANGRLTGRFSTPNCKGRRKVERLSAMLPDRGEWHVTAYGDSPSDRPVLGYADESHYKPFRK